jgi:hypothetical protein
MEFPITSKEQQEPDWIVECLRHRDHAGWSTDHQILEKESCSVIVH